MLNTEGHGARQDRDGVHSYGFPWGHAARSPDVEDSEMEQPFMRLFYRLRIDSAGMGTFRGGAGSEAALVPRHVPILFWTVYSKCSYIPVSLGIFGGYPQASAPGISVSGTDLWEKLARGDDDIPRSSVELATQRTVSGEYTFEHSGRATRPGQSGDIIIVTGGGGGGYGDVLARDPELVMQDLQEELISEWTARNVYGVVFDEKFFVDEEETERTRAAIRKSRIDEGQTWDEFMEEWSQLRPTEEALEYFGSWPEGVREHPLVRI